MTTPFMKHSADFLVYLERWMDEMPAKTIEQALPAPQNTALLSEDIIKGFCSIGPLASHRIAQIVPNIVNLMQTAWDHGVRHILLSQDTHEPQALEFQAYPPHCVRGTEESEAVDEIKALSFYDRMIIMPKNSVSAGIHPDLGNWVANHPEVDTFVVVGDCTDICVYQAAMYLRQDANERQIARRVIVPADCVDTYPRTIEEAQTHGGLPHPADLMHAIFLYHMALNGIEVVKHIG